MTNQIEQTQYGQTNVGENYTTAGSDFDFLTNDVVPPNILQQSQLQQPQTVLYAQAPLQPSRPRTNLFPRRPFVGVRPSRVTQHTHMITKPVQKHHSNLASHARRGLGSQPSHGPGHNDDGAAPKSRAEPWQVVIAQLQAQLVQLDTCNERMAQRMAALENKTVSLEGRQSTFEDHVGQYFDDISVYLQEDGWTSGQAPDDQLADLGN